MPYKPANDSPDIASLPFVATPAGGEGRNFWAVGTTQHYGQDCLLGHALAHECLAYLGHVMNEPDYDGAQRHLLGNIVLSMLKQEEPARGVVVGFFYELSRQLEPLIKRLSDQHGAGSCLLYTSPSPRDRQKSRMPSSA